MLQFWLKVYQAELFSRLWGNSKCGQCRFIVFVCKIPSLKRITHPYILSLRSILILSFRPFLSISGGFFTFGFPTKILYAFLTSHLHAACPDHHKFLMSFPLTCVSLCCRQMERRPDEGGSNHPCYFDELLPDYTAQQPKTKPSLHSPPPWEPQISQHLVVPYFLDSKAP
jgi:hypothetical protein